MSDAIRVERFTWYPGDVEIDHSGEEETRIDDFNPDQPRAPDGKFGSGGSGTPKSSEERAWSALAEHASRSSKAEAKVSAKAAKAAEAHERLAVSTAEARAAGKAAKIAVARASKTPTPANLAAAHAATAAHAASEAQLDKHSVKAAQRGEAHAKAKTSAALAGARLREAQRATTPNQPLPKPVALEHGIGFERIAGEHETGAQELEPTPAFHFGGGMSQIGGEHDHPAVVEPKVTAPKPKETTLEMLERTRPHYVHQPVSRPPAPLGSAESNARQQAEINRQLAKYEAGRAAAVTPRAVEAVSLPTPPPEPKSVGGALKKFFSGHPYGDTQGDSEDDV